MNGLRRRVALNIGGSVLAAGVLVALFLMGRGGGSSTGPADAGPAGAPDRAARKAAVALVDRQIDTVLARFGVPPASVKKRSYDIPEEDFTRTERMVPLPDSIAIVSVNDAMNDMARSHGGRAAATENPRLGIVTIHIELAGSVVHTVILKRVKSPPDGRQTRPAT